MSYYDKRNGSGYWDPTAYQAIKNVEKENMEAKNGHIWTALFGEQEIENAAIRTTRDMYREEYHKILEYFFKSTHLEARP